MTVIENNYGRFLARDSYPDEAGLFKNIEMKKIIVIIAITVINIAVLRAFNFSWPIIALYNIGYLAGSISWAFDFEVKVHERD